MATDRTPPWRVLECDPWHPCNPWLKNSAGKAGSSRPNAWWDWDKALDPGPDALATERVALDISAEAPRIRAKALQINQEALGMRPDALKIGPEAAQIHSDALKTDHEALLDWPGSVQQ